MKKILLLVLTLTGMSATANNITCHTADPSRLLIIHGNENTIEFVNQGGSASVLVDPPSVKSIETIPPVMETTYAVGQYNLIIKFGSVSLLGSAKIVDAQTGALRMYYPLCTTISNLN